MKVIILLIPLLLLSCTSYPRAIQTVDLGLEAEFPLVQENGTDSFSALQKVTVEWQGKKISFNVQLQVEKNELLLVGLTPVFSRSFLISYKSGTLHYEEHPYFRYPVDPEAMVADFQMAFTSITKLRNHLKGNELILEQKPKQRTFSFGQRAVVTVNYENDDPWNGKVTLKHLGRDYTLEIKTVQFEE